MLPSHERQQRITWTGLMAGTRGERRRRWGAGQENAPDAQGRGASTTAWKTASWPSPFEIDTSTSSSKSNLRTAQGSLPGETLALRASCVETISACPVTRTRDQNAPPRTAYNTRPLAWPGPTELLSGRYEPFVWYRLGPCAHTQATKRDG